MPVVGFTGAPRWRSLSVAASARSNEILQGGRTGTGKAKKAGAEVVFAAGLFDAGKGQFVGASFVVDSKIEEHYKETVRGICETIRFEKDFSAQPRQVAKPVIK